MNRRAIGGRRLEMSRYKKLRQVFSNAIQPGIRRLVAGITASISARKRTQEWIAHVQASVSASRFGPKAFGGGYQSAIQKSANEVWLPTKGKSKRTQTNGKGLCGI
jgi:ABC-type phosphonate transport system ATPase subunit